VRAGVAAADPLAYDATRQREIWSGRPAVLGRQLSLDLAQGRPLTPATLLLSPNRASIPLPGPCVLLVDPTIHLVPLPMTTNANGVARMTMAVPSDPVLGGLVLYGSTHCWIPLDL
jgi:hypothetical protein